MIAITHVPSPKMEQCERSFVARTPIDYRRATRQHEEYCRMLRACGADVVTLDINRDLADCAFVEDTAIVLDEVAVLASMGTECRIRQSRRRRHMFEHSVSCSLKACGRNASATDLDLQTPSGQRLGALSSPQPGSWAAPGAGSEDRNLYKPY